MAPQVGVGVIRARSWEWVRRVWDSGSSSETTTIADGVARQPQRGNFAMENKTTAAMAGLLVASLASWDSYDKDNQRRLRNLRDDNDDLFNQLREYISRGEQIRGRLAVPMDAQLGLALANPATVSPEILPTNTKLSRPVFDEESVSDLSFPPKTGTYDGKGRVSELGEMTRTFLALTFQELRAFLEGLAQDKSPSQAGLLQINRAAHQLISVLATLNLSSTQYAAAWQKLFSGLTASTDPHLGTPIIGTPNGGNNVASVTFSPNSAKSDRAMRIRITAGGGIVGSGADVVSITFASEWKDANGNPVVPAIVASQGLYASLSSSTGFTLQLSTSIGANLSQDFSILVSTGGSGANASV